MGSISRMNRNERFIEAFAEAVCNHVPLKAGDQVTIHAVYLDDHNEETHLKVSLKDERGETWDASLGMLFDPEYSTAEDVTDRLTEVYGLSAKEVREKLLQANLFDPEDIR